MATLCGLSVAVLVAMSFLHEFGSGPSMSAMTKSPVGIPPMPMSVSDHAAASPWAPSVSATARTWLLMVVVMMGPSFTVAITSVRRGVLVRRRTVATVALCTGYLGIWMTVGPVAGAGIHTWARPVAWMVPALCGLAALWQYSPVKRAALDRCEVRGLRALYGGTAIASEVGAGARLGAACLVSCWPIMAAMAFAMTQESHHVHSALMIVGGIVVSGERLTSRPRQWRSAGAAAYAGLTGLVLLLP